MNILCVSCPGQVVGDSDAKILAQLSLVSDHVECMKSQ